MLASRIAREHCPPTRYASLLPDLVQEANLALIQATNHFAPTHKGDFTDYVCAWMRAGVKGAVSRAAMPIAIPYRVRVRAREEGTLEQWYRLQPVSLDRLMNEEEREESSLVATLVAPSIPQTPPAARDEAKRAFVEQLLSYLSPRAQAVLRLRHGLVAEDDERPRTTGEIAQELGITPNEVSAYERDGLRRLRALLRGEARLVPYQGRVAVSLGAAGRSHRGASQPGGRFPARVARQARLPHRDSRGTGTGPLATARRGIQATGGCWRSTQRAGAGPPGAHQAGHRQGLSQGTSAAVATGTWRREGKQYRPLSLSASGSVQEVPVTTQGRKVNADRQNL